MQVHGIDVRISRKRIKNINLRIDAQGKVNVSAPIKCSLSAIELFLQEKQGWILKHRERLLLKNQVTHTELSSGNTSLFLGEAYELIIHEHATSQRVFLDGNNLHCCVEDTVTQAKKALVLQQWHRVQMKALIPDLLVKWEPVVGVHVNEWGIKVMKTRWGSCNTVKKRIWLNLHLIHQPLICLEYVLVHELVHLLEASHNQRFYALMSQFMPDWRVHKTRLHAGVGPC